MSHECNHGSCSHKHHSHSSECCSCSDKAKCDCACHRHSHKYSDELLALADEAWMELIKEKIKEQINKNSKEHIERIAELVAKANHARWTHKMDEKKNLNMYEEELNNIVLRKK